MSSAARAAEVAPSDVSVHLYALCWNEERMLPYFLRHYESVVDRFFVFDDGSTDLSRVLLERHPKVELAAFNRNGDSYVLSAMRFYREAWKESRGHADWVIVCNVDEHVYHRDLLGYLMRCRERGVTLVGTMGYEMVGDGFPEGFGRLCDEVVRGVRWDRLDKVAIFDPTAIAEIGYSPGRHVSRPTGDVVFPARRTVKLLHYKHLGLAYLVQRQAELRTRLLPGDVAQRYGIQYLKGADEIRRDFEALSRAAVPVL